jgi:glycerophosphoryl diester phosphodiesterase
MNNQLNYILTTIFFLILLGSCISTPEKIDNLSNGKITSIGHGGPGIQNIFSFVPLNTKAGFKKAWKNQQLAGVEMDVQMSSDGKLVLFHDEKLQNKTNGKGKVIEHTYEELTQYTYANEFYHFSKGKHTIPGLEDVLTELKSSHPEATIVLDLKLYQGNMNEELYIRNYASELINTINRTQTYGNVCIESMNPRMLQVIQSLDKQLKLFLYTTEFENGIRIASENKFYGVTIKHTKASKETVQLAHSKGLRVSLWGPRTKRQNSIAIGMHPDYIQSDKINDLVKKLRKY